MRENMDQSNSEYRHFLRSVHPAVTFNSTKGCIDSNGSRLSKPFNLLERAPVIPAVFHPFGMTSFPAWHVMNLKVSTSHFVWNGFRPDNHSLILVSYNGILLSSSQAICLLYHFIIFFHWCLFDIFSNKFDTMGNFMSLNQRRTLMKTFIESQFGYCPLIWIFHSRIVNKKINHLHERALRIAYKDYISSFEDLLKRGKSVTIHHRNIQSLAIELFKVLQNLSNAMLKVTSAPKR